LAVVAVMIAITALFTVAVRLPIPATGGYVNFSDVAIYFTSFIFGPWVGFVGGGVGAALADIFGGYAQFAPLTFLAHGLEGLMAGLLARRRGGRWMLVGWAAGTVVMVGAYLLGEGLVLTGWGPALAEAPFNLLQNVVGGLVGIPLVLAVRRAYPPITQIGQRRQWREEEAEDRG
jgi:energy-coupling factor transport system substrate-specific component